MKARSLFDIAVRDEAKEMRPDARPQAWKNWKRIRWNTLRIFSGRERRRWSQIVRRSRTVNVGQAPRLGRSRGSGGGASEQGPVLRPPHAHSELQSLTGC